MKKRKLFVLFPLATLTLSGCSLADGFNWFDKNIYSPIEGFVQDLFGIDEEEEEKKPGGDEEKDKTVYDFVLEDGVIVTEKETGILHEISVSEVKIDLLGYSEEGGKLGSIKRDSYNGSTFNGMIYNRTLISGIEKLRVDFSGGTLQYVFTEFLMEDMDFDSKTNNKLESGKPVEVPEDACYFVIYNRSTSPVNIDALKLKFEKNQVLMQR